MSDDCCGQERLWSALVKLPSVRLTRDSITYAVGVGGVFNEVVLQEFDPGRVAYFIGFLGLLGAPFFLRKDEAKSVPEPEKPERMP